MVWVPDTTLDFEAMAIGDNIVVGTPSIIDAVNGAGTKKIIASPFSHGLTHAAQFDGSAAATAWARYPPMGDQHTGQAYFRPDIYPNTAQQSIHFRDTTTASVICTIGPSGAGKWRIVATGATQVISTVDYTVTSLYRLDWQFDKPDGTNLSCTCRIFKDANVEGTTPDDTITINTSGLGGAAVYDRQGFGTAVAGHETTYEVIRWKAGIASWPEPITSGPVLTARPIKVWNGSAWVIRPLKVYDGANWVPRQSKIGT